MERTEPRSLGVKDLPPIELAAKRYGTRETCDVWGAEKTFGLSLDVQAASTDTLHRNYPDIIPVEEADELIKAANLETIDPDRIREIEAAGGHDVDAINIAWGEQVSPKAGRHINELRASADTTESAKVVQIKKSLETVAVSVENLRDITLERAFYDWKDIPYMDTSHLYDAAVTVLGRPFVHYAEMLQSNLDILRFVYKNSLMGKWADSTGNYHSATALGVDGMLLEDEYCKLLGINHMDAPAQIPGREFLADSVFVMARTAETLNNLARFIATNRGDDVGVFVFPRGKKGSTSMPHKDAKGGNPTAEEQVMSFANYMRGDMVTALSSCEFPYARNLAGSASDRINFETMFKFGDHVIRRLAKVVYNLIPVGERSIERIERTYGTTTSQRLKLYLTDHRKTDSPMTNKDADDIAAELAKVAYDNRVDFTDVLLESPEITSRFDKETIKEISDPFTYLGESKCIVEDVFRKYHGKKTLGN